MDKIVTFASDVPDAVSIAVAAATGTATATLRANHWRGVKITASAVCSSGVIDASALPSVGGVAKLKFDVG